MWILFVAWSTASIECFNLKRIWMPPSPVAGWFLDKLKEITLEMGLQSEQDFEKTLRRLPWVRHFCAENCKKAWKQMDVVEDDFSVDEFLVDEYEL